MDKEILFKIKKKLERLGGRSITEAGTKEAFINPLISALGWDVSDFDEVKLEYKATKKDTPVDYALMDDRMNPKLFIEAKQLGLNLDDHKWIAQVLVYCSMAGVKWALLTDGNQYKLYNTTAEARIEEKLFFDWKIIDITEKNVDKILDFLCLLTKEKLKGKDIHDRWQEHYEVNNVKKTLIKLIGDRDESLLNLIRRKTKLKRASIVNSLNKLKIKIEKVYTVHTPSPIKEKIVTAERSGKINYTGTTPEKARLFNESFEVKTWKDLLVNTAEKLMKLNPDAFNKLPDSEIMKTVFGGTFLTKDKSLLRIAHQLSNGLFLEINLDASTIVRVIKRRLLKGCGYKETDIEIFLKYEASGARTYPRLPIQ